MKKLIMTIALLLCITAIVNAEDCFGDNCFRFRFIMDSKAIDQTLLEKIRDIACDDPVVIARRNFCSNAPDAVGANCNINADCGAGTCLKKRMVDIGFARKVQVQKLMDCLSGDTGVSPLCTVNYNPQAVRLTHSIVGTNQSEVIYNAANKLRYKRMLPDVCIAWTGDTCTTWARPTSVVDIHHFYGYPVKDMETLDQ